MADNKKYYYLKLKETFFDLDNIKIIESMPNGYIYSNILLKLYLKSLKGDGKLMMTDRIPYDPKKIDILANVIGHDPDHVKQTIKLSCELDIITILDSGEIWINDIQNYIGQSSTEADRKRKYRLQLDKMKTGQIEDKTRTNVQTNVPRTNVHKNKDKSTLELELEIDLEKERERERERETKNHSPSFSKKEKYHDWVFLTQEKYKALQVPYEKEDVDRYILKLNNYIGENPLNVQRYKNRDHYYTLLNWMERDNVKKRPASKEKNLKCAFCGKMVSMLLPGNRCTKCYSEKKGE